MTTATVDRAPEKLRALHTQLETAFAELVSSDQWARILAVAARFRHYSPANVLLILRQRPDACYEVADPLLRARKGRRIGFDQRHLESRIEERDRDALTHRAAADHGGALERPRRPGRHVRARPARLAFGEKGVAKRL